MPTYRLESHRPVIPSYTRYLETGATKSAEVDVLVKGDLETVADAAEMIVEEGVDALSESIHPDASLKVQKHAEDEWKTWQTPESFLRHETDRREKEKREEVNETNGKYPF